MRKLALLLALVLIVPPGCTHRLSVDQYPEVPFVQNAPARPIVVGVVDAGGGEFSEEYVGAVAKSLAMQAGVSRVVYPYVSGAQVDVIANIAVEPEYKGAGTNFLVNWPGFLVFAPAWNGYKYQGNPRTRVQLVAADGSPISELDWEHNYVFHQADIGRTWTMLTWLESSIIGFIGGIVFIRYDTDQTGPFVEAIEDNFGRQLATRIVTSLAAWTPPAGLVPDAGGVTPELVPSEGY